MAGTVDLPAIGKVKSTWVWAGGGLIAVILGIAWYKHKQNAASPASTAGTDTAATTDPATGYPAGSAEDQAALAAQGGYGYGSYGGGTGGGYSGAGSGYGAQQYYYDPADGLYDLTSPYTGTTGTGTTGTPAQANTGPGTFTSDAYWVQYAIENVQGYSPADIQAALSLYLAGQGLTTTQMSIYQAALAVAGEPPSPPSQPAHLASQPPPGGSGGGGGGPITAVPAALHVTALYTNSMQMAWDSPSIPAGQGPLTGFTIECYDSSGHDVNGPFTVPKTQLYANIGSLKSRTTYHANVWCEPARTGGPHASVTFTTK